MKVQVSGRQILAGADKIFTTGYCALQTLFPGYTAPYYHAGLYGWNADYFPNYSRGMILVTGYRTSSASRGFKTQELPYNFVRDMEEQALAITRETHDYREREQRLAKLRELFWDILAQPDDEAEAEAADDPIIGISSFPEHP